MTLPVVLAADGGNSKTDLALVRGDGAVLAVVRGPLSSPHHIGLDGCLTVLEGLLAEALASAGLGDRQLVAAVGNLLMAGADLPAEERELQAAISARGWAARTTVNNDTFAILRAGTDRGWGVAVTCGAGINCVGVAPDGRHARFPALGVITGDWGGGYDVGLKALWAAARSEDGRGPKTLLERAVPAHFGLASPYELAEAIHQGRIPLRRVLELAPVVLGASEDDAVTTEIVERLANEVLAFVRVALARLDMTGAEVEVLLGGGLMRAADGRLLATIDDGLQAIAPAAVAHVVREPPIVGAALLGLDELGAGRESHDRMRQEMADAVPPHDDLVASAVGGVPPIPAMIRSTDG